MSSVTIITCNNCPEKTEAKSGIPSGWVSVELLIKFGDQKTMEKTKEFKDIFESEYPFIHLCPSCMRIKKNWEAPQLLQSWLESE